MSPSSSSPLTLTLTLTLLLLTPNTSAQGFGSCSSWSFESSLFDLPYVSVDEEAPMVANSCSIFSQVLCYNATTSISEGFLTLPRQGNPSEAAPSGEECTCAVTPAYFDQVWEKLDNANITYVARGCQFGKPDISCSTVIDGLDVANGIYLEALQVEFFGNYNNLDMISPDYTTTLQSCSITPTYSLPISVSSNSSFIFTTRIEVSEASRPSLLLLSGVCSVLLMSFFAVLF
eukprot:TRINITY_DN10517_c0_g1_i1.p1 TRINITY_DN10517_c0_g1~~TRINITY_DN10517_c0_g1_i1.p1  ORF type:complete len:240 (+),score=50.03 TRINITY_DN10517_c0_g1_i1:25-720(+)